MFCAHSAAVHWMFCIPWLIDWLIDFCIIPNQPVTDQWPCQESKSWRSATLSEDPRRPSTPPTHTHPRSISRHSNHTRVKSGTRESRSRYFRMEISPSCFTPRILLDIFYRFFGYFQSSTASWTPEETQFDHVLLKRIVCPSALCSKADIWFVLV